MSANAGFDRVRRLCKGMGGVKSFPSRKVAKESRTTEHKISTTPQRTPNLSASRLIRSYASFLWGSYQKFLSRACDMPFCLIVKVAGYFFHPPNPTRQNSSQGHHATSPRIPSAPRRRVLEQNFSHIIYIHLSKISHLLTAPHTQSPPSHHPQLAHTPKATERTKPQSPHSAAP